MPSKVSKTTRKHGTVTRIKLYADEIRAINNAARALDKLGPMLNDDDEVASIRELRMGIRIVTMKYTDYQQNQSTALDFDESSGAAEKRDTASNESSQ